MSSSRFSKESGSFPVDVAAYLQRIQVDSLTGSPIADLKRLNMAHRLTVPFENLDIFLKGDLPIDESSLFDKLVRGRRGGICYELNLLFYHLLTRLGYEVTLLGAKVEDEGTFSDHLALMVKIEGTRYLADVGFGNNFLTPLELETYTPQEDLRGTFLVEKMKNGLYRFLKKETSTGLFSLEYVFTSLKRYPSFFDKRKSYYCTSKNSLFRKNIFCSLERGKDRISLKHNKFIVTEDSYKQTIPIDSFDHFYNLLTGYFDIRLEEREKAKLSDHYRFLL